MWDGLLCDLDGVVYRGDEAIEGASGAIAQLRSAGVRLVFCTNNSRSTVAEYQRKLASLGIQCAPDEILTSAAVTGEVLGRRGLGGGTALVVGGDGLRESLVEAGMKIVEQPDRADVVAVGYDPSFDYDAMRRASAALRRGAAFVATNDDATFPAAGGELWPGAGAILASLVAASGRKPEVMGKPHDPMMDAAECRLAGASRIAVVGDRPNTDLSGGARKGWTTILVLSGVTPAGAEGDVEPRPDLVLRTIAELPARLLGG